MGSQRKIPRALRLRVQDEGVKGTVASVCSYRFRVVWRSGRLYVLLVVYCALKGRDLLLRVA